jgi:small subunit ribosomal protein S1
VVLSRRKLLEEKQGLEQETLIQEKKPGDTINGKVVKLEKYGAFIEVAAGIEGLVHISEISHQRIADPAEVLSVGQMVSAKIISIGTETGRLRISLSLKNAEEDPWNNLESKLKVGSTVDAQITQLTRFGAFASAGGVEGLIPLSEISSEKRVTNPGDLLQIGQKVRVLVQEIKMDQKRISFSMKDAAGDSEWKQFEPSTQKGLGTLAEQFNKLKMEAKPKAKL